MFKQSDLPKPSTPNSNSTLDVKDLEKILDDIKFALWWETQRMVKIEIEKAECQKYVDLFNKFLKK